MINNTLESNHILLTGSSGFLGSKILCQLKDFPVAELNQQSQCEYCLDLSTSIPNFSQKFDLVIHNAGLAHTNSGNFYKINVQGTRNLLEGLSKSPPTYFVFISSVSVYGRLKGRYINEKCALLAKDQYGKSKIQAEIDILEWCHSHQVLCTILRLPLVVGLDPPGNLGAMIRGIKNGVYSNIAGGNAHKSMVLADDVAKFILPASRVGGTFNLTDGEHPTFKQLSYVIAKQLHRKRLINIPLFLAKILARFGDIIGDNAPLNSLKLIKITSDLTFDDSLAREKFEWTPRPVLENFKIN
jgi:nucleoside-diphosphate-sugar epimerase